MELARIEPQTGELQLVPATLEKVKAFPTNTKWIVVFGVARGGKSTLCNLLSRSQSFAISDATEPCTAGLWISEPILINGASGEHLVVVDSEGTELGNVKYQHKLLALACLLACSGGVLIHNEKHYAKTSIGSLAVIASTMKLLKGLEKEQFPYLCFIAQNFEDKIVVNGQAASVDDFFTHALSDVGDKYDTERKLIRECFTRRKMFTMPPVQKKIREAIKLNNTIPDGCAFKAAFSALTVWLDEALEVKKVGGILCGGKTLTTFMDECVKSINEHGGVEVLEAVSAKTAPPKREYKDASVQTDEDPQEIGLQAATSISPTADKYLVVMDGQNTKDAHVQISISPTKAGEQRTRGGKRRDPWEKVMNHLGDLVYSLQVPKYPHHDQSQQTQTSPPLQQHLAGLSQFLNPCQPPEPQQPEPQQPQPPPVPHVKQAPPEVQAACTHDYSLVQSVPVYDYKHRGRWGGFLHGHKCCGQCSGYPRCIGNCNQKCMHPIVASLQNEFLCKKCGAKTTHV